MQKLDGTEVSICGYMSKLLPASGEFMYLMNLPYQKSPFSFPNTTQLANTIAVYAKPGQSYSFTDRAIRVTGILEFGNFTDELNYEYSYRIKDAEYTVLGTDDLDSNIKLWQQLASTDVIADIYRMYEYVNFLCFWPTYTAQFEGGSDYLYPSDIDLFCKNDDTQFNYGYKEGYFDDLVAKVESVSKTDFVALVGNIRKAEALAKEALAEIDAGNYTQVAEYSNTFGDGRNQYRMNKADEFDAKMQETYREFAEWLATWKL
ncbi:MAG: hypothetical protein J6S71_04075 [Clostridia bacterium]|nr:hypothetical protein [Clostridia bacterium]